MQETKDILKQVKKLEITTKQLVDGLITGNYHSVFKGQGIEFSEIRDYRPGDDVRAIDWKVTARLNHPYIKEFIEERDLQVYFVIDMSGSGSFGNNISKKQKGLELAASLMFAALRNNDKVGAFLFTDKIEKFIPARKGRKHILKVLSTLVRFLPKSVKTDLANILAQISKIVKRRSIIFIISDFYDGKEFFKPLKILRNKHDVIALSIIDVREKEIPNVGLIELEDEETGEQILVNTSDEKFRNSYLKLMKDKEFQLNSNLKRLKIDSVNILTDDAYELPLRKFFKKRHHR